LALAYGGRAPEAQNELIASDDGGSFDEHYFYYAAPLQD
jgi:hypothetical protein